MSYLSEKISDILSDNLSIKFEPVDSDSFKIEIGDNKQSLSRTFEMDDLEYEMTVMRQINNLRNDFNDEKANQRG